MNARKRFSTKDIALAIVVLILSATGALASVPGIHRTLAPQIFGIGPVGANIFIDQRIEADKAYAMVSEARSRVSSFFGNLEAEPRIVICVRSDCYKRIGGGPRGATYGDMVIKIGPEGFNQMIMTHEMFHAELHRRMGTFGMIKPVIPSWFNEGMATMISNDNRYRENFSPDEIAWIKQAKSYWGDWGDRIAERGWRDTYGAAKAAVIEMKNEIGLDGLRQIIDLVTRKGMEFDLAVSAVRRRNS